MPDVLFLAGLVIFFAIGALFVRGCDAL